MSKTIIIFILLVGVGILILLGYNHLFKRNSKNALAKRSVLKLPDLNDIVITYIIFCTIVGFFLAMKNVEKQFTVTATTCIKYSKLSESFSNNFDICINEYNNTVFKNQDEAIDTIKEHYGNLMNKIEIERSKVSSDAIDNIYYLLQNNQQTEQEEELYILLSIYRNFYETDYREIKVKGGY